MSFLKFDFDVSKLNAQVNNLTDKIDAAEDKALIEMGMAGERFAAIGCPVDTGLLRNSITFAVAGEPPAKTEYKSIDGKKTGSYSGSMPGAGEKAVYIGTNVEYAPYVEAGHGSYPAQNFLKNAATGHNDTYKKIIENCLKEIK